MGGSGTCCRPHPLSLEVRGRTSRAGTRVCPRRRRPSTPLPLQPRPWPNHATGLLLKGEVIALTLSCCVAAYATDFRHMAALRLACGGYSSCGSPAMASVASAAKPAAVVRIVSVAVVVGSCLFTACLLGGWRAVGRSSSVYTLYTLQFFCQDPLKRAQEMKLF